MEPNRQPSRSYPVAPVGWSNNLLALPAIGGIILTTSKILGKGEDMIEFKCPKCKEPLSAPDSLVGENETCPKCGNVTIVPNPPPEQRKSESHSIATTATPRLELGIKQCPKCKEWIHKEATICPRCQSKQPAPGARILAVIIVAGLCIWGYRSCASSDRQSPTVPYDSAKANANAPEDNAKVANNKADIALLAQLETEVQEGVAKGVYKDIDVEIGQVRMSPDLWLLMDVHQKQGVVLYFSRYFDLKKHGPMVKILSDQNDTILGEYGLFSGVEIKQ
jgi:rRNA maturation protein Nop10